MRRALYKLRRLSEPQRHTFPSGSDWHALLQQPRWQGLPGGAHASVDAASDAPSGRVALSSPASFVPPPSSPAEEADPHAPSTVAPESASAKAAHQAQRPARRLCVTRGASLRLMRTSSATLRVLKGPPRQ